MANFKCLPKTDYGTYVRIELEPVSDNHDTGFWGDNTNPNGRIELYVSPSQAGRFRLGGTYRVDFTYLGIVNITG